MVEVVFLVVEVVLGVVEVDEDVVRRIVEVVKVEDAREEVVVVEVDLTEEELWVARPPRMSEATAMTVDEAVVGAGMLGVEVVVTPQAFATYMSQSSPALPARCMTGPQGSDAIMRPGKPHFVLHLDIQSAAS